MADPVTLNFKERRRPLIILQLDEGDFEIDPNLEVEDIGEGAVAEEAVNRAFAALAQMDIRDKQSIKAARSDAKAAAAIAGDFIHYLIKQRQPKAKKPRLGGHEILEIFQVVSGNKDGFSGEVIEALTTLLANTEAELAAAAAAHTTEGEDEQEGEQGDPLASKKPSRKRSSRSAGDTSGGRSTGKGSRGASSKRTSPQPEPATV
jgi:hypothetical protein